VQEPTQNHPSLNVNDWGIDVKNFEVAKIGVRSDMYGKIHLHFPEFEIAQAGDGRAAPKYVFNTRPIEEFLKFV